MARTLRILLRRSKDEGQENSLDTQLAVCLGFAEEKSYGALKRKTYIDDGVAGDDFEARAQLHLLMAEVQSGDIVVCLDQSRLGRKMRDCFDVVDELLNEKGAKLYYAATRHEVTAKNAIEQFMVYAQSFGAQQEKESNQQRTRAALREKVRRGETAGGSRYGYTNGHSPNPNTRGRATMNTKAEINANEAAVVRRIFRMYLDQQGLTRIAKALNAECIPSPSAGTKRGSGSWSPGAIREMLRRERYRGIYVHGKTNRKR